MRSTLLITGAVALGCLVAIAQAPVPATYDELGQVWNAVKGGTAMQRSTLYLVPPLSLRVDADGKRYLFVAGAGAPVPKPGFGLVTVQLAGASTYDLLVDSAVVMYRVRGPVTIGSPCNGGTGAFSPGVSSLAFCAPTVTPGEFVWASVPYSTTP